MRWYSPSEIKGMKWNEKWRSEGREGERVKKEEHVHSPIEFKWMSAKHAQATLSPPLLPTSHEFPIKHNELHEWIKYAIDRMIFNRTPSDNIGFDMISFPLAPFNWKSLGWFLFFIPFVCNKKRHRFSTCLTYTERKWSLLGLAVVHAHAFTPLLMYMHIEPIWMIFCVCSSSFTLKPPVRSIFVAFSCRRYTLTRLLRLPWLKYRLPASLNLLNRKSRWKILSAILFRIVSFNL